MCIVLDPVLFFQFTQIGFECWKFVSMICIDMNPVYNDMKMQNTLATDGAISAQYAF